MSDTLGYLQTFARFPIALRKFLREPITLAQAKQSVQERMEQRSENFLRMLERSVYNTPRSPYRALLQRAGCELGDVRALVQHKGVEGTLRALREADVFVTFEEFKGRKPIRRNEFELHVTPRDFDNPAARHDFTLTTGGSTGAANAVYQDLDHIAVLASNKLLKTDAHGFLGAPAVHWTHMLPGSGIRFLLQRVKIKQPNAKWYAPLGWREFNAWLKYDTAMLYMLFWLRAYNAPVPFPQVVKPDDALIVARQVRNLLDRHERVLLYASVSQAVRVALAAQQAGFRLDGAGANLMSEPLTQAKAAHLVGAGMKIIAGYGSIETGRIGLGCAKYEQVDDVHIALDAFALIDYPYAVPNTDVVVPALNLTSLRSFAPNVMLNYQSDDYGILETRACGCPLEAYGFTTHLHDIRSYSKLVGEGVTLIGNEMLKILEEQLPARFGGSPLDYQMMEREDEKGFTRLVLLIHPRVVIQDENAVIPFVLNALRESSPGADAARAVWQRTNTLQLERREPIITSRGKLLPLHIQRSQKSS